MHLTPTEPLNDTAGHCRTGSGLYGAIWLVLEDRQGQHPWFLRNSVIWLSENFCNCAITRSIILDSECIRNHLSSLSSPQRVTVRGTRRGHTGEGRQWSEEMEKGGRGKRERGRENVERERDKFLYRNFFPLSALRLINDSQGEKRPGGRDADTLFFLWDSVSDSD